MSVVSLLLNVGVVTAIALISVVQGAQALSTLALALAVIAFFSQLVIFAVQAVQSGSQLRQARELNSSTLGLIAAVSAKIEETQYLMKQQHEGFMGLIQRTERAKIADAPREIGPEPNDSSPSASALETAIDGNETAAGAPAPLQVASSPATHPALQWPEQSDQAEEYLSILESIAPFELTLFTHNLAFDLKIFPRETSLVIRPEEHSLIEAGLMTLSESEWDPIGEEVMERATLTTLGRRVGSILAASIPKGTDAHQAARANILRNSLSKRARNLLAQDVGEALSRRGPSIA